MYTYEQIVDNAIAHTGINISYDDALQYVQKRRDYIVDTIKEKIHEKYFWDIFTNDTIAWQNEYTLPLADATANGVSNIERVEIKWLSWDRYRVIQKPTVKPNKSVDELADISREQWFYELNDSSIFIYPTPTESVTGWLYMEATTTLPDITTASISSDFFGDHTELRNYVPLIIDWLCVDLFARARQYDDKAQAQAELDRNIQKMVKTMSNRVELVAVDEMPNDLYDLQ